MNPKAETFFDAITLLREDLVEEAQNYVFRRKRSGWKKFGSLAACVMLVMSLGLLTVMPRGCGAAAPKSADMNSSGAAPTAPAEMPPDANGDIPYGDSHIGGGSVDGAPRPEPSGEPAPRPPEGGDRPDLGGLIRFSGQVLEVLEDAVLVEPFDELPGAPERVRISTVGLENPPAFYPGGVVMVTCQRLVLENGEALAEDVTALDLVEPDTP